MPLKIIGVGFGRTGTASTYTALNQLGFPCYHMVEVIRNKANRDHLAFWLKVAEDPPGTPRDWETVFANYTATVDNPACCVWRELIAAYPDAKVLLTLHPKGPETWVRSVRETIYFTETMWQFQVLRLLTPFGRRFGAMSRKLIWERFHRGSLRSDAEAIAFYNDHVETIKAALPPERLLIFSADQGWTPLCRFLGVAEPDTPFPNVNDRAEFQKVKQGMARGAYVMMALWSAGLAALAYGACRLFG